LGKLSKGEYPGGVVWGKFFMGYNFSQGNVQRNYLKGNTWRNVYGLVPEKFPGREIFHGIPMQVMTWATLVNTHTHRQTDSF